MRRFLIAAALISISFTASAGQKTIESGLVGNIVLGYRDGGTWRYGMSIRQDGDGAEILGIVMESAAPAVPQPFSISFTVPQTGIFNLWSSDRRCVTHLDAEWGADAGHRSSLSRNMPLYEYFDDSGNNRLTIACDEVFRQVDARLGIREDGCGVFSELNFFNEPEAPLSRYELRIRLDGRPVFWSESIEQSSSWMMESAGLKAMDVPEAAFEPLYSTWYQFHQKVNAGDVEEECSLAAAMGMKTVIVDDGWQTEDCGGGYAWCGDWQPAPSKFPDMAGHVRRIHRLGMKYMLWYSVPFVGWKSRAHSRFEGKYLRERPGLQASVLDPRFPEVRRYLVDTYTRALKEWDLDGFKLDFIDDFCWEGEDPALKDGYAGRDIPCLSEAVNTLMKEIAESLRSIKPDIMIEFRQRYIGPAVRQYGNMFRATDCPGNAMDNRMRTASLRLTSGTTAVHSDMLEWNAAESAGNVGRAIISSIFSVTQYSAMLRELSPEHRACMEKYIRFAREHRETLLRSSFRPLHPELNCPVIEAESKDEHIVAVFQDNAVIDVDPDEKRTYVLNACGADEVVMRMPGGVLKTLPVKSGDWTQVCKNTLL